MSKTIKKKLPPTLTISLGYFIIIAIGTLLLMLPISTRSGQCAGIETALFTATSATCVTGLVIQDTYTFWSLFGQIVILCMIQIGGVGFLTLAISAITLTKKKISLYERTTLRESFNSNQVGGVVRMSRFIICGAAIIEFTGAVVLSFRFIPEFGVIKGIYFSFFHSISAFCNAGFDLMGDFGAFSSLTHFKGDIMVNITIMLLIIIGGIGFFVWSDLLKTKFKFRKMRLHTKIVLVTTSVLIVIPFVLIMIFEGKNGFESGETGGQLVLESLFQAITPRTAGFNTADLGAMSDASLLLMMFLMLVGGSPSSTAGGFKTTTLAIMFMSIFSVFSRKKNIEMFKRRIENEHLIQLTCVFSLYFFLFIAAGVLISGIDNVPIKEALFETASAIGTVGLTLSLTPLLSGFSHLILIALMFFGRVGGLTIILSLHEQRNSGPAIMPVENVTIG